MPRNRITAWGEFLRGGFQTNPLPGASGKVRSLEISGNSALCFSEGPERVEEASAPLLFVFAVLRASMILIFLASAFVFAEHHQEGDWTKICVQVCVLP